MKSVLKADLHVHSKYSKRPSEWILQKIGCAESYTEPKNLYSRAMERGMDFVTITDHNTIEGGLEISHLPRTFISEEVTTYFPENGCKLHVLAWGISEKQHSEIQRARSSVYDLVSYLRSDGIIHGIAHPLYDMNGKHSMELFEKLLLLFDVFELNGSRDNYQNRCIQTIVAGLTPEYIGHLADKHDLQPCMEQAWKKTLVSGSDDHSSLTIAKSYTEVQGIRTVQGFLYGLQKGEYKPQLRASGPKTMAYNLYSIAYQFYRDRFSLEQLVGKDILLQFIDQALTQERNPKRSQVMRALDEIILQVRVLFRKKHSDSVKDLFEQSAFSVIKEDSSLAEMFCKQNQPAKLKENSWYDFVNQASTRILTHMAHSVIQKIQSMNIFDIFHTLGTAGSSYMLLTPYIVAYSLFTKDRRFCDSCVSLFEESVSEDQKQANNEHVIGYFFDESFSHDDSFVEALPQEGIHCSLQRVTCSAHNLENHSSYKQFTPVGMSKLHDKELYFPELLTMVDYCYEQNFSTLFSATPGPVGLAGLAIAHVLKIPIYGAFQENLPQSIGNSTGDVFMEEGTWRYLIWFYNQCHGVVVSNHSDAEMLIARGIPQSNIILHTSFHHQEHSSLSDPCHTPHSDGVMDSFS